MAQLHKGVETSDLHGISGDVRGEDLEDSSTSFCQYYFLVLRLAMARLSLNAAQENLLAR